MRCSRIGRSTGRRSAIDAGATLVVTNHPHVIQGMEIYAGKPIVYSVGNFIFDQMFSVQTRQGLILELVLRGGKCVGLRTRGVEIEDFNQPRLMTAGEQAAIMDRFWASTDRLANREAVASAATPDSTFTNASEVDDGTEHDLDEQNGLGVVVCPGKPCPDGSAPAVREQDAVIVAEVGVPRRKRLAQTLVVHPVNTNCWMPRPRRIASR